MEILRRVVAESKGPDTTVAVVTTASMIPRELERTYSRVFRRIGVRKFNPINIMSYRDADDDYYSKILKESDLVFFTGGDQLRLTKVLKNSLFMKTLEERYREGSIVIAGTSAGAAAMSDVMIYGGESRFGLIKEKLHIGTGFSFVKNIAFDTHFVGRGRILRLFQVVASDHNQVGIGLSENTGILMKDDYEFEVIGKSSVIVVDGTNIRSSNFDETKTGELLAVENFHVHSLISGNRYNLKEKRVIH